MKYVCLGYIEDGKWDAMSDSEQKAMMEECFAYDDVLRRNGHFLGGEALQSARTAATLRWQQESGLRIIHLAGDVLHCFGIESRPVREHRQLISTELLLCENVSNDEMLAGHANLLLSTLPIRLMPSSIISGC